MLDFPSKNNDVLPFEICRASFCHFINMQKLSIQILLTMMPCRRQIMSSWGEYFKNYQLFANLILNMGFLTPDGKNIFWCLIILSKILMEPVLLVFTTSVFKSRQPRSKATTTTAVQNGINRWRSLMCLSTAFKSTNFDKIPSTKYLVCWKKKISMNNAHPEL